MRICYISVGGFIHVFPYLDYFNSTGHEVHFIALTPAPDYGVPTYNVGVGRKYSPTEGKWKYPISMLRARRIVRKIRPDIVHTHYVTSGGLTGLICGFHPTITTVHGSDLNVGMQSKIWRPLLKAIFRQATCVNTCTEDQKRKVMSLGTTPEKIRVLTLGVDTERYSFKDRQPLGHRGILKLVTTRRLEPVYNHSTIIEALTVLQSKNVDFQMTFVAGGGLLEKLKHQAEKAGLTDRVRFLGGVPKKEVVDILQSHDIFLSAPNRDGISVAQLEAMATGLFPIVSNIEVNADWIDHGVNGLLHEVGDADQLANCILEIRGNPELAMTAAHHNRKKVVELADTRTNMRVLEGIYQELIQKR